VGKRIVATPKSTKHIVTDAPCETCHFNTSTFFGARYNHGTAVPGQCENCHNGRIVAGKTSGHPVTTFPCDNCHRSSSWIPASWNHRDTVSDCSACHPSVTGPNNPGRSVSAAHLPMSMGVAPVVSFNGNCRACHSNYYTFLSAFYNHSGAGSSCQGCHGNGGGALAGAMTYTGVKAAGAAGYQAVHAAIGAGNFAAATCQSCHTSIATFLGARYNHSGATGQCGNCHASTSNTYNGYVTRVTGQIHTAAQTVGIMLSATTECSTCHSQSNFSAWVGTYAHNDGAYTTQMAANSCASCHDGTKPPIKAFPANHTNAFNAGLVTLTSGAGSCNACHTSTSTWVQMNHGALTAGGQPCKNCHDSGLNPAGATEKFTGMRKKSNGHKGYNNLTQDCISCHINQYSFWNEP
jgi:hypothetical protein